MGFVRWLHEDEHEDEKVVLELRPHGVVLLRPALAVPVLAGIAAFAAAVLPAGDHHGDGQLAILATALLLLLRLAVLPWLRWLGTRTVLTTDRIMLRSGVLARRGHDVPLAAVTDVAFSRSLLERPLRSGTLVVSCAGARDELVLNHLPYVEDVQRTLSRLVTAQQPLDVGARSSTIGRGEREGDSAR